MLKIISSKVAARKTIKAKLQKEIPPINDALEKAMANGETRIYYDGDISKPTAKMLEKAGYEVKNWDVFGNTEISWYLSYNNFSDNDSEVEKLAKELDLEIVEMQKPQKI